MGALKTQLKTDLVAAMKAHDDAAKSNIRMALAAIANEEVAGSEARELSDAEELKIVTREVNKRKDSAEAYAAGGRDELAAKERSEAEFLSKYLPAQLSDAEIDQIVTAEIAAATEANGGEKPGMKQMGLVMKGVNAKVAGRADGKTVAAKVKAALA